MNATEKIRLQRDAGQVFLSRGDGKDRTPVRIVWARPISGRGGEISFLDKEKKEVLMLESLEGLDLESRKIAEEELAKRYLLPRITRVVRTSATFGIRYWQVETDLGERHFALKHASKNTFWLSEDHLVLRDTLGCLYEIRPFSALDTRSRLEVQKVI